MATIKSYTDINQSKKLVEILSLESADMYYSRQIDFDYFPPDVEAFYLIPFYKDEKEDFNYDIPCWSLAALLGILPEIQGGKPVIALDDNYITYPHISNLHTKAGNLVDACVAMIEKLHEFKML